MNISKFANHLPEKPFHSSGYAKVARGDNIGSTNAQPFSERLQVERKRQVVKRYHDSMVAHNHHSRLLSRLNRSDAPDRGVQSYQAPQDRQSPRSAPAQQRPQQAPPPPARKFTEPPKRGYNPYG